MTIYVESNFVLELALGQEQALAAEAIQEKAERGEIALALPAISLIEPFSTITQRARSSERLRQQVGAHLQQLARSHPHLVEVRALEAVPSLLASIELRELERLTAVVGRLLAVATSIPVDAAVYAEAITFMDQIELPPHDAMILASILSHLRRNDLPGPHFFISRNWRDFDDPRVHAELNPLNCEYLRDFEEGALRLEQPDVN